MNYIKSTFPKSTTLLLCGMSVILIWEKLFITMELQAIQALIPAITASFPTVPAFGDYQFWNYLINALTPIFVNLLPGLLLLYWMRVPIRDLFRVPPTSLLFFSRSVGFTLGANAAFSLLASSVILLLEQNGIHSEVPDFAIPEKTILAQLLYFISIVVIAPIIEEFFYRGVILKGLAPLGPSVSIFISAVLFSLAHGNLAQVPAAFLGGLIFGWIAVKTGSITIPILVHFCNNLLVSINQFPVFIPAINILSIVAFAFFVFQCLRNYRKIPLAFHRLQTEHFSLIFFHPLLYPVLGIYCFKFLSSFSS